VTRGPVLPPLSRYRRLCETNSSRQAGAERSLFRPDKAEHPVEMAGRHPHTGELQRMHDRLRECLTAECAPHIRVGKEVHRADDMNSGELLAADPARLLFIDDRQAFMRDGIGYGRGLTVIQRRCRGSDDKPLKVRSGGVIGLYDCHEPDGYQATEEIGILSTPAQSHLQFPRHGINDDNAVWQGSENHLSASRRIQIDDGAGVGYKEGGGVN
jgi:hypothetical protein